MKIEPMRCKGGITGAKITLKPEDACILSMIISYARNADVGPDGTPAGERKGRRLLFQLAAICMALDLDADAYLFRLSTPEQISPAERKAYDETRRLFDPGYGEAGS